VIDLLAEVPPSTFAAEPDGDGVGRPDCAFSGDIRGPAVVPIFLVGKSRTGATDFRLCVREPGVKTVDFSKRV